MNTDVQWVQIAMDYEPLDLSTLPTRYDLGNGEMMDMTWIHDARVTTAECQAESAGDHMDTTDDWRCESDLGSLGDGDVGEFLSRTEARPLADAPPMRTSDGGTPHETTHTTEESPAVCEYSDSNTGGNDTGALDIISEKKLEAAMEPQSSVPHAQPVDTPPPPPPSQAAPTPSTSQRDTPGRFVQISLPEIPSGYVRKGSRGQMGTTSCPDDVPEDLRPSFKVLMDALLAANLPKMLIYGYDLSDTGLAEAEMWPFAISRRVPVLRKHAYYHPYQLIVMAALGLNSWFCAKQGPPVWAFIKAVELMDGQTVEDVMAMPPSSRPALQVITIKSTRYPQILQQMTYREYSRDGAPSCWGTGLPPMCQPGMQSANPDAATPMWAFVDPKSYFCTGETPVDEDVYEMWTRGLALSPDHIPVAVRDRGVALVPTVHSADTGSKREAVLLVSCDRCEADEKTGRIENACRLHTAIRGRPDHRRLITSVYNPVPASRSDTDVYMLQKPLEGMTDETILRFMKPHNRFRAVVVNENGYTPPAQAIVRDRTLSCAVHFYQCNRWDKLRPQRARAAKKRRVA